MIVRTYRRRHIKMQHTEPSPERERVITKKNCDEKVSLWVYCALLVSYSGPFRGSFSRTGSPGLQGRVLDCGPIQHFRDPLRNWWGEVTLLGNKTSLTSAPHHASPQANFSSPESTIFFNTSREIVLGIKGSTRHQWGLGTRQTEVCVAMGNRRICHS